MSVANPLQSVVQAQTGQIARPAPRGSFIGQLGEAIGRGLENVSRLQAEADELAVQLVLGELDDIHQLTVAMEKAKLGLQLAVQIRNKAVEAYQEIARMQI